MLPIRPPVVVHHMAALDASDAPPNSVEAIEASLRYGAAFIEVDVTALADSDYLLVHDPLLEGETTGRGPVGECTERQARDLLFVRSGAITSCHVPRLGQVVELFRKYPGSTRLQLDFKNLVPFGDDEPLERLVRLIEPLGDRVLVSTSADWQLRRLRRLAPWLDLGLDVHFYVDLRSDGEAVDPQIYPRQLGAYGYWDDHPVALQKFWPTAEYLADRCATLDGLVPRISTFYISHKLLVRSLDDGFNWAEALHDHGIKLDAWTLDVGNPRAEVNAKRLLAAGVDQFTTNTPVALAKLLAVS